MLLLPETKKKKQDTVSTRASHARALSNMGRLLEDTGHPDEALLCFKEGSSADTGSVEALCCRAGNLQRRGDFDGAAVCFEGVSLVFVRRSGLSWARACTQHLVDVRISWCPIVVGGAIFIVFAYICVHHVLFWGSRPKTSPSNLLHHAQSQALARDQSLWSAWYGLGLVKGAQGKHADAVEALSRWLEGLEHKDGEEESGRGVSAAGKQARECREEGGGGGETEAAMAKGLVQLGNAYRKLGQV